MKKILIGLIILSSLTMADYSREFEQKLIKDTEKTQGVQVLETWAYNNTVYYQRVIITNKSGESQQWYIKYVCDRDNNILEVKKYRK